VDSELIGTNIVLTSDVSTDGIFVLLMLEKKYEHEMASSGSVFTSSNVNIRQFVKKQLRKTNTPTWWQNKFTNSFQYRLIENCIRNLMGYAQNDGNRCHY
jgi:hypothetical protein